MTNWAQVERGLLCDAAVEHGPDAATLCGAWTVRDLLAHLVLRERRPDAAPGIVIRLPVLGRYTDKVQQRIARTEWDELVGLVRSGPPRWSPTSVGAVDQLVNTVEFFVHHEDIRRAQTTWEPRQLPADEDEALAAALGRMKMLLRRAPVGLELRAPDGTVLATKAGARTVTLIGPPGELLLYAFGRKAHARVTLEGTDEDVAAVQGASFGL